MHARLVCVVVRHCPLRPAQRADGEREARAAHVDLESFSILHFLSRLTSLACRVVGVATSGVNLPAIRITVHAYVTVHMLYRKPP